VIDVRVRSFPPLEPESARLLILGSMPGIASLCAARYYAHPRNLFWPFMEALFGVPLAADYEARVAALLAQRIALWDVLEACERPGSLDGSIVRGSEVANDIPGLLARHPELHTVALNGGGAQAAFRRHVRPRLIERLGARIDALRIIELPSTSPANAGVPVAAKVGRWSVLKDVLG
jgi:hypoxanthine-DNA glycosylase